MRSIGTDPGLEANRDEQSDNQLDFGRRIRTVRSRRLSFRMDLRSVLVTLVLSAVAIGAGLITLTTGSYELTVPEVLRVLAELPFGGDGPAHLVVVEWRLPRVLMALVLGACLAVSGAIFQSLTRNPLGSPDIIGFSTGAYTGAIVVIILTGGGYYATAGGALGGGILTAAAVYLLAYRRGVQGFRLIIVGIGLSAMLSSVNTWLIVNAELETAMSAAVWGAGSLNGLTWDQATPAVILALVLAFAVVVFTPRMPLLEMGDDTARALGLGVERTRLTLTLLGVALTALVTAAAGPIAFVALCAPQLAKRLVDGAATVIAPAAAMGAAILAGSDLLAQRVFGETQLPVGVVTVCVGGIYLVWLLVKEARRQ